MSIKNAGKMLAWAGAIAAVLWLSMDTLPAKEAKMKAEEVLAKHLESIGKAEVRGAIRSRVLSGTAQVTFRLPSPGQLNGKSNIISEGRQSRIGMQFQAIEYPMEQLACDGDHVTVSQVRPGARSPLGRHIYTYDVLMKEGLIGGVLTTAWALLDVPGRQAKLDYTGLKKFEGKPAHEMKYRAKKGAGDFVISLYFEPETFRHIGTVTKLVQPASMGRTPTESSGQRDTIYQTVEQFSDFVAVDLLTLPKTYKLVLTIEAQNSTVLTDYVIQIEQLTHNETVDSKLFTVQ